MYGCYLYDNDVALHMYVKVKGNKYFIHLWCYVKWNNYFVFFAALGGRGYMSAIL
jgi:hypothetical protein